ncbi:unnamed protein product [Caenorhabditis auriculariae]|uniref:Uncharacterized protein n=1 Tax=Caenorhabditis auriculariae TaxID=2777116 RepID=A0A8S1HVP5_9PELO|nr:unnamed protein product [Caenorhabditis auriculariae]
MELENLLKPQLLRSLLFSVDSEPNTSASLPAILLVRCGQIVEAIGYVDNFNDRRSALVIRILADSMYLKTLTKEYVLDTFVKSTLAQIEKTSEAKSLENLAFSLSQSVVELEVVVDQPLLADFENLLMNAAEHWFAQLPLSAETLEETWDAPIYCTPETSSRMATVWKLHSVLHILFTSLAASNRLTQQLNLALEIISSSSTSTARNGVALMAEKYKGLLNMDTAFPEILRNFTSEATDFDMQHVSSFFEYVQEKYAQKRYLPPLSSSTREVWLRSILLSNEDVHRGVREEFEMDWLRGSFHPKHKVSPSKFICMQFINSQWTPPGFSTLANDGIALRLGLHPQDICLAKSSNLPIPPASARESIRQPVSQFEDDPQERLFSPRDLISVYAQKAQRLGLTHHQTVSTAKYMRHTLSERLREFSNEQEDIQAELSRESAFLKNQQRDSSSTPSSARTQAYTRSLREQIADLNFKLDQVMQSLNEPKQEPEEDVSELESLELEYDKAPIAPTISALPIEKLDFSTLSPRPDVGKRKTSHSSLHMSTAKSFVENKKAFVEHDWMRLLPLEPTSDRKFQPKLLTSAFKTSSKTTTSAWKAQTDRGVQTSAEKRFEQDSGFLEVVEPIRPVGAASIMSREEIHLVSLAMSTFALRCFLLLVFVSAAAGIACQSCDAYVGCHNPIVQHCHHPMQCYTVRNMHGAIVMKGCAPSCSQVNEARHAGHTCTSCNVDNCNRDMPMLYPNPGIGGGVQPNDPYNNPQRRDYEIGGGVRPRSSTLHTSFISIPFLIFLRFFL